MTRWGWASGWEMATTAADARLLAAEQRFDKVSDGYERLLNEAHDRVTALERQLEEAQRRGDLLTDRLIETTGMRGVSAAHDRDLHHRREESRALRDTIEFDELDELPFGEGALFAKAEDALVDTQAREEDGAS